MRTEDCENCGSRCYNGYCTYCDEEYYILEAERNNNDSVEHSEEFYDRAIEQDMSASERRAGRGTSKR